MPFEARPLPQVIWVGDEAVVGPFCKHCGYPFSLHSDKLLCPKIPNGLLGPSCDCHQIRSVETVVMVGGGPGRRRQRRVGMRKEIVKV